MPHHRSRQTNARGIDLDNARTVYGIAPADANLTLLGQPHCVQELTIITAEVGRMQAAAFAGAQLRQWNRCGSRNAWTGLGIGWRQRHGLYINTIARN